MERSYCYLTTWVSNVSMRIGLYPLCEVAACKIFGRNDWLGIIGPLDLSYSLQEM